MQCLTDSRHRVGSQLVTCDRSDSTGQVLTLHSAVTYNHNVFQCGGVFFQSDGHVATAFRGLRLVANIRELEGRASGSIDAEVSVNVGHRSLAVAIGHAYSNQGFAGLVLDGTLDCILGEAR